MSLLATSTGRLHTMAGEIISPGISGVALRIGLSGPAASFTTKAKGNTAMHLTSPGIGGYCCCPQVLTGQ
ncbi:hypothetical protein MAA_11425 [Metarhizium robertsii ARSEF 23]|uniref:Uncharacterized protein n=1 Tax=Metarhizium robertsii (strain ARSEF 23 / ATCC MYA-3075) TaxID=655844 RepID=A0A0B2X7I9_METRA|nr:uncharacterized protein MAA_11425 [Metarhizium robertsii ARSEF 23]KHO10888.1 hypothetical protein MAA_11425 [Metarhizium robertsii ARSEF 23]